MFFCEFPHWGADRNGYFCDYPGLPLYLKLLYETRRKLYVSGAIREEEIRVLFSRFFLPARSSGLSSKIPSVSTKEQARDA